MKKTLLLLCFFAVVIFPHAQNKSIFFVHIASVDNIEGHITFLDHPLLNNNPDAHIIATQNWNPPGGFGVINPHTTAVYYEVGYSQWAIYNEDLTSIPTNVGYNVMIILDDAAAAIVHIADLENSGTTFTNLSGSPFDNGQTVLVFENHYWNPFGVYNNNETGVWWTGDVWSIFNENGATQLDGAGHIVMTPGNNMRAFNHFVTAENNTVPSYSMLDHPDLNGHPEAIVLLEQNWNPPGGFDMYNTQTLGVWYDFETTHQWVIYTQSNAGLNIGNAFNVLFGYPQPDNDECADASNIDDLFHQGLDNVSTSEPQNNNGATTDNSDPMLDSECWYDNDIIDNSIWYSFVGDGELYNILTNDCSGGSGDLYINLGDTQMAIYQGSCGDMTMIDCNDDSENASSENLYSEINLQTEEGVTYYILIDGYSENDGPPADGEFCIQVTQLGVGVEEVNGIQFNLYPNPTKDLLNITSNSSFSQVDIINSLGQLISSTSARGQKSMSLNCADLPSGFYVARVSNELGSSVQTFIKD